MAMCSDQGSPILGGFHILIFVLPSKAILLVVCKARAYHMAVLLIC
jgi:hypothetical protein